MVPRVREVRVRFVIDANGATRPQKTEVILTPHSALMRNLGVLNSETGFPSSLVVCDLQEGGKIQRHFTCRSHSRLENLHPRDTILAHGSPNGPFTSTATFGFSLAIPLT